MTAREVTTVEELRALIGQELGVGPWHTLTQERLDAYLAETGEQQWIYTDPQRAASGPFGGMVAPAFMLIGMTSLLQRAREGIQINLPLRSSVNYGINAVQINRQVRVGQRIRARTSLVSVDDVSAGVVQITTLIAIEVDGETEPALTIEHVNRSYLWTDDA